MFLQIHTLTSYHASLLNRDDAGLAKRIPFGDATRLRISSQCLKRHWRETLQQNLDLPSGMRTRHFFSREILPNVVKAGVGEDLARQLTRTLANALMKSAGEKEGVDEALQLKQPVLFGRPEADYMVRLLTEASKAGDTKAAEKSLLDRLQGEKKNFATMLRGAGHGNLYAGIEGALFGRFVTSDILARSDAAVHVAHAFTVHALDTEVDYFTVVDDLGREEETGAAHAGDMELGAGVFYGYVAVDVPLLVSNFTGCDTGDWEAQGTGDVCDVLKALIRAIATVSPGAKLGATAPYAYSDFVLLEAGRQQPRSLANAYLQALRPTGDGTQQALDRLAKHLQDQEKMYGATADRRALATTLSWTSEPSPQPLDTAIQAILKTVFGEKSRGRADPAP